jgi:hypothetical protein
MFQEINDWAIKRCGKITSSEVYKIMNSGRKEFFSQTGKSYIKAKVAEYLTQEPISRPTTYAMEWGNSHEFEAITVLKEKIENEVTYHGIGNPEFFSGGRFWGGSPDALTQDCVIEVKCPFNSSEHLEHLLFKNAEDLKEYAPEYYWQIVSNMLLTNKEKAMFISYDPRFPEDMRLKILEFNLDKSDSKNLIDRLEMATKEIEQIIKSL